MTVETDTPLVPVSQPTPDLDTQDLLGDFPDGPHLVGTGCNSCGQTMIGTRVVCSSCVGRDVRRVALPDTGVLYSFTRLHVGGAGPRPLGYVDLEGGVRTLADLQEGDAPLHPDLPVELVVDGQQWSFAPRAVGAGR